MLGLLKSSLRFRIAKWNEDNAGCTSSHFVQGVQSSHVVSLLGFHRWNEIPKQRSSGFICAKASGSILSKTDASGHGTSVPVFGLPVVRTRGNLLSGTSLGGRMSHGTSFLVRLRQVTIGKYNTVTLRKFVLARISHGTFSF